MLASGCIDREGVVMGRRREERQAHTLQPKNTSIFYQIECSNVISDCVSCDKR
jgi:hypothetical protein